MDVVEKQIVHEYDENHKEYASKGVAGTGLGLGIAGTALGLLALSGRGLFGLGQLEIGAGKIKMDIPMVNKSLVLNQQDLNELKDMLSH